MAIPLINPEMLCLVVREGSYALVPAAVHSIGHGMDRLARVASLVASLTGKVRKRGRYGMNELEIRRTL